VRTLSLPRMSGAVGAVSEVLWLELECLDARLMYDVDQASVVPCRHFLLLPGFTPVVYFLSLSFALQDIPFVCSFCGARAFFFPFLFILFLHGGSRSLHVPCLLLVHTFSRIRVEGLQHTFGS
jgi:hypothetical protein